MMASITHDPRCRHAYVIDLAAIADLGRRLSGLRPVPPRRPLRPVLGLPDLQTVLACPTEVIRDSSRFTWSLHRSPAFELNVIPIPAAADRLDETQINELRRAREDPERAGRRITARSCAISVTRPGGRV
jgi:hypothetical protein